MTAARTKDHSLTADELRSLLHYGVESGRFTRISKPSALSRVVIGAQAGTLRHDGYRMVVLGGVAYMEHRLAFLYMTGAWPREDVDHINGQRADNRWANLRDVPKSTNRQNMRRAKLTNSTGLLGVGRSKRGRYQATICVGGSNKNLGIFDDPSDAHAAYLSAKRKLHDGCTI